MYTNTIYIHVNTFESLHVYLSGAGFKRINTWIYCVRIHTHINITIHMYLYLYLNWAGCQRNAVQQLHWLWSTLSHWTNNIFFHVLMLVFLWRSANVSNCCATIIYSLVNPHSLLESHFFSCFDVCISFAQGPVCFFHHVCTHWSNTTFFHVLIYVFPLRRVHSWRCITILYSLVRPHPLI